jgi:hypothetical protein
MTLEEINKLLLYITGLRPTFRMAEWTAEAWLDCLGHLDYEIAKRAVRLYCSTQGRDPGINNILETAAELTTPGLNISVGEAWRIALNAARSYGAQNGRQGLATLPGPVQDAARQIGWQTLCLSDVSQHNTLRAQFRDIYTTAAEKCKEQASLPDDLRRALAPAEHEALPSGANALPASPRAQKAQAMVRKALAGLGMTQPAPQLRSASPKKKPMPSRKQHTKEELFAQAKLLGVEL